MINYLTIMKPVKLKPNSAEFADEQKKALKTKACDMPGCVLNADFRAPKDRSLTNHYWFCQTHVSEYNKAWNYFSGMPDSEIHDHMKQSFHGFRPTRPFSDWNKTAEDIERDLHGFRYGADKAFKSSQSNKQRRTNVQKDEATQERDALQILGLEETLDFDVIKKRYKDLAKKLHPDINPENAEAEDQLKKVNMAYTILKLAFAAQNYEKL